MYLNLRLCVIAGLLLSALPAHAAKKPHSLATDQRVKQTVYDQNQVYEVVGSYGYQTSIEFAPDEQVKVAALGDSIAWQAIPYKNRLFLKPVEQNAATNLTVLTNKRAYYFRLSSARPRAVQTFLVRFVYPESGMQVLNDKTVGKASLPNVPGLDPAALNLDYGMSGDKNTISLKRVFDDGQFTYFLFNQNTEIPAFYTVGADGTESIVNTRREGQYMVVERTASLYTLRNGNAHLCVQNKAAAARQAALTTQATREL